MLLAISVSFATITFAAGLFLRLHKRRLDVLTGPWIKRD